MSVKAGAATGWMKPAPLGQIFPLSIPYDPTVDGVDRAGLRAGGGARGGTARLSRGSKNRRA